MIVHILVHGMQTDLEVEQGMRCDFDHLPAGNATRPKDVRHARGALITLVGKSAVSAEYHEPGGLFHNRDKTRRVRIMHRPLGARFWTIDPVIRNLSIHP